MTFLWPPRPEKAVPPILIRLYEERGYVAQRKKNGTCQVISIDPEGNVEFRTRHNELNKAWTPPEHIIQQFKAFRDTIFVGELLHSKHASVKNRIVLFDVLRYGGETMQGKTLEYRLKRLDNLLWLTDDIEVIKTETKDLTGLYHSLSDPIDEGIVLKDPKARLLSCKRKGLNGGWQVKVRRETKNYSF